MQHKAQFGASVLHLIVCLIMTCTLLSLSFELFVPIDAASNTEQCDCLSAESRICYLFPHSKQNHWRVFGSKLEFIRAKETWG